MLILNFYSYANLGLFPYACTCLGERSGRMSSLTCHWQVYEDTLEGVYLLLRREMQETLIEHERFWQVAKVQMTRVCTLEETAANYVNWKMIETLPYYKSVLLESALMLACSVCITHFLFLSRKYSIRIVMFTGKGSLLQGFFFFWPILTASISLHPILCLFWDLDE